MKRWTDCILVTITTASGGLALACWLFERWIQAAVDAMALPLLWMTGTGS